MDESIPFSTFTDEAWQDFLDEAYKWLGKMGETINQLCFNGQLSMIMGSGWRTRTI